MQRRQRAARDQGGEKAAESQREVHRRERLLRLLFAVEHPAQVENHHREQVGRSAEEIEQQVREQRTHPADAVLHFRARGRLAESRIRRIVSEQREPKDEGERPENVQRTFPEGPVHLGGQSGIGPGDFAGFCHG